MKNFTPAEERLEIERLARAISSAQHGVSPDTLIMSDEPRRLNWGPVLAAAQIPLWSIYTPAAKAMFDDMRRQEELAAQPKGDLNGFQTRVPFRY